MEHFFSVMWAKQHITLLHFCDASEEPFSAHSLNLLKSCYRLYVPYLTLYNHYHRLLLPLLFLPSFIHLGLTCDYTTWGLFILRPQESTTFHHTSSCFLWSELQLFSSNEIFSLIQLKQVNISNWHTSCCVLTRTTRDVNPPTAMLMIRSCRKDISLMHHIFCFPSDMSLYTQSRI